MLLPRLARRLVHVCLLQVLIAHAAAAPITIHNTGSKLLPAFFGYVLHNCTGGTGTLIGQDVPAGGSLVIDGSNFFNAGENIGTRWDAGGGFSAGYGSCAVYSATAGCTLYVWPGGGGPPPANWNYQRCVTNNTPYAVIYHVHMVLADGTISDQDSAPALPNTYYCFSYNGPQKADIAVTQTTQFYNTDGTAAGTTTTPVWNATQNGPNWWQDGGSPTPAPGVGYTGLPAPVNGTSKDGNTIQFDTTDNTAARESTLQTVGKVLYETETAGFQNTVNAINGLRGALGSGGGNSGNVSDDGTHTRLDTANSKLDLANTFLASLNTSASAQQTTLNAIAASAAASASSGASTAASVSASLQKLEDLKALLVGVQNKIDAGTTVSQGELAQLTALGLTATTMSDNIAIITPNSTAIKASVASVDAKMSQLINAVNAQNTIDPRPNIDAVKNSVDGVKTSVDATKSSVDAIKTSTDAVKASVDLAGTNLVNGQDVLHHDLLGISNRLVQTPAVPDVNAQSAQGQAAAQAVATQLDALATSVHPYNGSASFGDPLTQPGWVINLRVGGRNWVFNCNPMANSQIAALAAYCRALLTWLVTVCFWFGCLKAMEPYLLAAPMARQAQAAGTAILGNNLNTAVALLCAAAITTALAAIPVFAIQFLGGHPFPGLTDPLDHQRATVIDMALALADAFIPLALIFTDVLLYVGFRAAAAKVWWLASTITRFIVG